MAPAAGRFGSPTTGLLGIVLAIVVVLIALVAPAGAIAHHNSADTVAGTHDGAIQLSATADRSASSSRRDAGAVGSYVYDHASTRASDDAGVPSAPDREVLATKAADAARSAGKQGGAAAQLDVPGSRPFVDVSGSPTPIRPEVQQVLDDVPVSVRKPWHGGCAEPRCVSQALDVGVDPRGGTMTAVQIGDKGLVPHGAVRPPCPSCEALRDAFGYDQ